MKKHLWILFLGLSCYGISCNTKTESGLSAAAQNNLDVNHAIIKCFETKDFSKLGDYIATDAIGHAGDKGDIKGLDSMKIEYAKSAAGMDDQKTEVIKELADDDYVMDWNHYTGTVKTDGMGHKAGDKIDMKVMEVARFKDGKAVEHWSLMEPAELMKMMGNMQQPMAMPDSTKKKM